LLAGGPAHRLGLVHRRHAHEPETAQRVDGVPQVAGAVAEVRAEAEEHPSPRRTRRAALVAGPGHGSHSRARTRWTPEVARSWGTRAPRCSSRLTWPSATVAATRSHTAA